MKNGFYMTFGNKGLFYENSGVNITDKVARAFINAICDYKGIGVALRKKSLYDAPTLKDFKKRIDKATIEKRVCDSGFVFYSIKGNNFTANYPVEDFENEIIMF